MSGMPTYCYKPTDFYYCPEGAVCNYLHQNARVTKNGGEESPFGPGCASYTVCNIDNTQSTPTYDLKCIACETTKNFTEVLTVSGRFGSNDDFGGVNNGGGYCSGTMTSVCLNVTSWDTCPAKLAGVGAGRRMLRGAENPWEPLDLSWKGLHGGLDERRLTCDYANNCDTKCDVSFYSGSCDCDACDGPAPSPVPNPAPVPNPTPSNPTPSNPTPAPGVSCNYLVDNVETAVEPGNAGPINNCADYTMCDNSSGKLTIECTKCKEVR